MRPSRCAAQNVAFTLMTLSISVDLEAGALLRWRYFGARPWHNPSNRPSAAGKDRNKNRYSRTGGASRKSDATYKLALPAPMQSLPSIAGRVHYCHQEDSVPRTRCSVRLLWLGGKGAGGTLGWQATPLFLATTSCWKKQSGNDTCSLPLERINLSAKLLLSFRTKSTRT